MRKEVQRFTSGMSCPYLKTGSQNETVAYLCGYDGVTLSGRRGERETVERSATCSCKRRTTKNCVIAPGKFIQVTKEKPFLMSDDVPLKQVREEMKKKSQDSEK